MERPQLGQVGARTSDRAFPVVGQLVASQYQNVLCSSRCGGGMTVGASGLRHSVQTGAGFAELAPNRPVTLIRGAGASSGRLYRQAGKLLQPKKSFPSWRPR